MDVGTASSTSKLIGMDGTCTSRRSPYEWWEITEGRPNNTQISPPLLLLLLLLGRDTTPLEQPLDAICDI
ncbi:hypothetical protein ACLOJK_015574 [Asimina triloba]